MHLKIELMIDLRIDKKNQYLSLSFNVKFVFLLKLKIINIFFKQS